MVCYRHPDRETGVSCQRCERFICAECQTSSAVGFLCPEDSHVPVRQRVSLGVPYVTYLLIALNVAIYVAQWVVPGVTDALLYYAPNTAARPLTMVTSGFVHSTSNVTHILFNMYSLYVLGQALEPMLGKLRFVALYLLSIVGGSFAVLMLAPAYPVVGASGGIFGLMAAFFVIQRKLRRGGSNIVGIIAVNVVLGFLPGIAWQAHLGGLVVGGITALLYLTKR